MLFGAIKAFADKYPEIPFVLYGDMRSFVDNEKGDKLRLKFTHPYHIDDEDYVVSLWFELVDENTITDTLKKFRKLRWDFLYSFEKQILGSVYTLVYENQANRNHYLHLSFSKSIHDIPLITTHKRSQIWSGKEWTEMWNNNNLYRVENGKIEKIQHPCLGSLLSKVLPKKVYGYMLSNKIDIEAIFNYKAITIDDPVLMIDGERFKSIFHSGFISKQRFYVDEDGNPTTTSCTKGYKVKLPSLPTDTDVFSYKGTHLVKKNGEYHRDQYYSPEDVVKGVSLIGEDKEITQYIGRFGLHHTIIKEVNKERIEKKIEKRVETRIEKRVDNPQHEIDKERHKVWFKKMEKRGYCSDSINKEYGSWYVPPLNEVNLE